MTSEMQKKINAYILRKNNIRETQQTLEVEIQTPEIGV